MMSIIFSLIYELKFYGNVVSLSIYTNAQINFAIAWYAESGT